MDKLPILMYHNVTTDEKKVNRLTIHQNLIEKQFQYLSKNGYQSLFLKDLEKKDKLTNKSVVITFDDVTKNQLEFAVPLLKKYNLEATFFIPFAYIGKQDEWNNGEESIMTIDDIKNLSNDFELAFHSYSHRYFADLSIEETNEDFELCKAIVDDQKLQLHHSIAYPYGNFPRKNPEKELFFEQLKAQEMIYGFRIGNRLNHFPFKNPYEINRIDIKGTESLWKFIYKLNFGMLF